MKTQQARHCEYHNFWRKAHECPGDKGGSVREATIII